MATIVIISILFLFSGVLLCREKTFQNRRKNKKKFSTVLYDSTMKVVGNFSGIAEKESYSHIERVAFIVEKLLKRLKKLPGYSRRITSEYIDDCVRASILHDIGKTGIPETILFKPGSLTESEYSEIKNHCVIGAGLIEDVKKEANDKAFLCIASEIARSHHERWDGSGYPDGLKGEVIPLPARVMAVADVYDALISDRPYKRKMSHWEAVQVVDAGSGIIFDPDVIKCFNQIHKEIYKKYFKNIF